MRCFTFTALLRLQTYMGPLYQTFFFAVARKYYAHSHHCKGRKNKKNGAAFIRHLQVYKSIGMGQFYKTFFAL